MPDDPEMMIRLTRLETLMEGFRDGQADMKEMLKQSLAIQESVTRQGEVIKALQESGARASNRLDSHSEWQRNHEKRADEIVNRLSDKMDSKMDELWKYSRSGFSDVTTFQNRLRGGMIVLVSLMGILGTICTLGGTWLVNTANEAQQINRLQAQELAELRRMLNKELK